MYMMIYTLHTNLPFENEFAGKVLEGILCLKVNCVLPNSPVLDESMTTSLMADPLRTSLLKWLLSLKSEVANWS